MSYSYFDKGWMDDEDHEECASSGPFLDFSGQDQPEKFTLSLPSTLGLQRCRQRQLQHAVDAEIQIRIGHCNDALQAIRLYIAKKSMLYKTEVRPAVNTKGKTRAYHKVQAADATLRCQAQIYRKSRAALKTLNAPEDVLHRFKELQAVDLTTTSTFLHPSVKGRKHKHLAWFWLLDDGEDSEDKNVMTECEWNGCMGNRHLCLISSINLVYRVNWLRASEGLNRCQEEVILVYNEMDWTVRYFSHQRATWLLHTSYEDKTPGHQLFGQRMTSLWDRLSRRALESFNQLKIQYPVPTSLLPLLALQNP